jgi:hypothetical protein
VKAPLSVLAGSREVGSLIPSTPDKKGRARKASQVGEATPRGRSPAPATSSSRPDHKAMIHVGEFEAAGAPQSTYAGWLLASIQNCKGKAPALSLPNKGDRFRTAFSLRRGARRGRSRCAGRLRPDDLPLAAALLVEVGVPVVAAGAVDLEIRLVANDGRVVVDAHSDRRDRLPNGVGEGIARIDVPLLRDGLA